AAWASAHFRGAHWQRACPWQTTLAEAHIYGKHALGENDRIESLPQAQPRPMIENSGLPAIELHRTLSMTYPNTQLFINGEWQNAADGKTLAVFNPSTGKEIGRVAHADTVDLDRALAAAQKGFETWRD